MKKTPEPLYATVEQIDDHLGQNYFLCIRIDAPGHNIHRAVKDAGRFKSHQEAIDYAIGKGVPSDAITMEAPNA